MTDGPGRDGPRYEDDFYAWTQFQAEVLRALPVSDNRFDREHLAEEIEDLGKSERDAVRSQIARIVEHLLKLAYSQADRPRYGWMASIVDARRIVEDKLSPTLRHDLETSLPRIYRSARKSAELGMLEYGETEAVALLPAQCPYSLEQLVAGDWYPEPAEKQNEP